MMDDGWPVLATLHHPITVDRDLDLEHATQRVAALHPAPLVRVPRDADEGGARRSRASSRCRSRAGATSCSRWACATDRLHIVPVGVDPQIFRPMPDGRARAGPPHDHRQRRRADEGARAAARGAGEGPHRARRRRARDHRQAQGQEQDPRAHRAPRPHRRGALRLRRHHRADRRALRRGRGRGRAVALRGLLAARDRGDGVRRAAGRDHRRRAARGGRHRRRDRPAGAPGRPRRARARRSLRALGDADLRARLGARGPRPGPRQVHVARDRGRHGGELPGLLELARRRARAAGAGAA